MSILTFLASAFFLLALLLAALFLACLALATLFHAISVYDHRVSQPPPSRRTLSEIFTSSFLDAFALFTLTLLYPLGWFRWDKREKYFALRRPRPLLLIHGLRGNRSMFLIMKRRFRKAGWGPVYTLNLGVTASLEAASPRVANRVDQILLLTGQRQVDLLGYGWGGLVARHYVEVGGGKDRVVQLVTLATAHRGTRMALMMPEGVTGQMAPGSPLVTELMERPLVPSVSYTALYSEADPLILPPLSGALPPPARSVALQGAGHFFLLLSGEAFGRAVEALGDRPEEGL